MLTTQDFLKLLQGLQGQDSTQDTTQLRYVIYARKSTTESEERQVRSLGDQVVECTELAQKIGLKVIKIIKEAESAKEPDIRPKFREMVEEIKKGKYEGIIAWHPDRLARNMKDAGEIIDLLDKQIIKDLHFVSFTFQNNTAGKMLLGIAFVLSKQYSDQLSDNVKRGIRRSIEEGKYLSRAKYGYYKDINKFLRPDGDNFTQLKAGWKMRLDGLTQEVVMKYLNENGFTRAVDSTGDKHEPYKWGRSRISEMFKDPFYTGVLKYGEQFVDLTEIYDFVPMVTVDDFLKINKFSNMERAFRNRLRASAEGTIQADLLRGAVICGDCGENMIAGITPKQNKKGLTNYFYYRCDNPDCKFYGKSIRAHVIVDFVCNFLENHKFTSKAVYGHYVDEMKTVIRDKELELESRRRSLQQIRRTLDNKIERTKDLLRDETDSYIKGVFSTDLKDLDKRLKETDDQLEAIKKEMELNKKAILSYSQFLELFSELPVRIRKTKVLRELDFMIRKIFLNFTIKDKIVASYQLNQPFDRLIKETKIPASRGREN